ncbi:hypothetical protein BDR26DRAFT_9496 [Obelidium mucronatum]|nr:hypothetical protein BDR26DRAFT_9496 [Obelidium mucronatum]
MNYSQQIKRFQCTVPGCGKVFTTNAHLSRHALNHSGVRKHKCNVPGCTSTFYRTDALNQHQKAHRRRYEQQLGYQQHLHPQTQMEITPEPSTVACPSSPTNNNANLLLQAANMIHTQRPVTPPVSPATLMIRSSSGIQEANGEIQSWLSEHIKRRKASTYFLKSPALTAMKSPVQYRIPAPPVLVQDKTSIAFLCD